MEATNQPWGPKQWLKFKSSLFDKPFAKKADVLHISNTFLYNRGNYAKNDQDESELLWLCWMKSIWNRHQASLTKCKATVSRHVSHLITGRAAVGRSLHAVEKKNPLKSLTVWPDDDDLAVAALYLRQAHQMTDVREGRKTFKNARSEINGMIQDINPHLRPRDDNRSAKLIFARCHRKEAELIGKHQSQPRWRNWGKRACVKATLYRRMLNGNPPV